MKYLISLIVFVCCVGIANAGSLVRPAKPSSLSGNVSIGGDLDVDGTGTFGSGADSTITLGTNGETIEANDGSDGIITFQGAGGGTADTAISLDLDLTNPAISSDTTQLQILDTVKVETETATIPWLVTGMNIINKMQCDTVSGSTNVAIQAFNQIGGSSWDASTAVIGGYFGNRSQDGVLGSGGSASLEAIGFVAEGARGISATMTVDDTTGIQIYPARAGASVGGDCIGIEVFESEVSVTGTQTMVLVEEPTEGATDYQVVLQGTGAGGGVWLGGTGGCRMNAQPIADACSGTVIETGATYELCVTCQ